MSKKKQKREDMNQQAKAIIESNKDKQGFWRDTWQQARLVLRLMRDPEVPFYLKILPVAAIAYVIWPIDIAPDFWPLIGQLDDLTALLVSAKVFIEMAPPAVVARHLQAMHAEQDAQYEVEEVEMPALAEKSGQIIVIDEQDIGDGDEPAG